MATKKKKIKPSFEIELLDHEKASAHKRLGRYDTPGLYSWAEAYYDEKGEFFTLSKYVFFRSSWTWILEEMELDSEIAKELHAFATWASKNFPSPRNYNGEVPGHWCRNQSLNWCRHPDGTWTVKDWNTVYTVSMKSYMGKEIATYEEALAHEPTPYKLSGSYIQRYYANAKQISTPSRRQQIEHEFKTAWKIARDKYRKANKAAAKAERIREEKARDVRKTKARMAVLLHIDKLVENLQGFKDLVEHSPEEITVERVREIFDDTNEMTSVNAELKKALRIQ